MQKNSKFLSAAKTLKLILGTSLVLSSIHLNAQTTTSHSPYSQFGMGQMREDLLPQTRSMGGISAGVRYQSGLPILNIANPASYSAFTRTILEAGLYANMTQLQKGNTTAKTGDFAFSHFEIGIPLAKAGGMAFGLLPYSDIGYNDTRNVLNGTLQSIETLSGEGGTNKAFVGYGVTPVKGLSIGANIGFIFGELKDITAISFPTDISMLNSRYQETRLIRGATVDYGIQYSKSLAKNKMNLTIGYSGSLNNTVNSTTTELITRTQPSFDPDMQGVALDTVRFNQRVSKKINLPLKHNVGFTLSKGYNWMVGADFKYTDWSNFQTREGEPRLGKNYGFAVGGQLKPDPTSVNYWNIVDYRLGFRYNKTHLKYNNENINDMAITAGLGFPLPESNFGRTFSRINISAEFGQQGTLKSNLIRERYININLGFTINDSWFLRRPID
ncbi:porin family protein [Sphingobacterium rhinopitheci]|uniref:hypothetical protein n=1 Tax=Sphingobacterium rhinopitheci TaxID=2781960 RepID=UPI001F519B9A|nr:hypothetical protein [Sphingobacterium rhinopitheci]MCI0920835.1 hypothetical protein [Sphingobacterium rhinopitheci]